MKYLYISLTLVFTVLSITLLQPQETPLKLITSPHVYSFFHTDDLELMHIDLLINQPDHYIVNKSYITAVYVENEDERIPLDCASVSVSDQPYYYQEEAFYPVKLSLKNSIVYDEKAWSIPDAQLTILYENGETISLFIGEWNYLYQQGVDDFITTGSYTATYEELNGIETIGGMTLEIINRTNEVVTITNIKVLSMDVIIDNSNITETFCEGHTTVEECIGHPYNNTIVPVLKPLNTTLLGGQSIFLYLPLTYHQYPYFHQGVLEIRYMYHNQEYVLIVDDFPLIQTTPFQPAYEGNYIVYEPDFSQEPEEAV